MPSAPPAGEPVPDDGALPEAALAEVATRPLSIYLHVPYCASRCGYCDFNTYTADELGPGVTRGDWLPTVEAELDLAQRVLGTDAPPVSTIFIGGGTPTLLPSADLVGALRAIEHRFGLAPDVEITTEANPDSVTPESLAVLSAGGLNRISFGMQSARDHVLQILDRDHTPGRSLEAVHWARDAGIAQVSLDLIYGTPGETIDDWSASLDAALSVQPDHLSAYSLIVDDGTSLAARIRRGEIADVDDDWLADAYQLADNTLSAAGLTNYEVSNWSTGPATRCRHNLAYWRGDNWWGVGPGAHSHVGGVRWWNLRHPRRWTARLASGLSPGEGREVLDADTRRVEAVLLGLRLAEGIALDLLTDSERQRLTTMGERVSVQDGRVTLTPAGRLFADGVVRDLLD